MTQVPSVTIGHYSFASFPALPASPLRSTSLSFSASDPCSFVSCVALPCFPVALNFPQFLHRTPAALFLVWRCPAFPLRSTSLNNKTMSCLGLPTLNNLHTAAHSTATTAEREQRAVRSTATADAREHTAAHSTATTAEREQRAVRSTATADEREQTAAHNTATTAEREQREAHNMATTAEGVKASHIRWLYRTDFFKNKA